MTERARYRFTVKEYSSGNPWLALEPFDHAPASLSDLLIGFDLPQGTTYAEAQNISQMFNNSVEALIVTRL